MFETGSAAAGAAKIISLTVVNETLLMSDKGSEREEAIVMSSALWDRPVPMSSACFDAQLDSKKFTSPKVSLS